MNADASDSPGILHALRGSLRIRSSHVVPTPATPPQDRLRPADTEAPAAPTAPAAPGTQTVDPGDGYLARLTKLFPAEILSIYPAGAALLTAAKVPQWIFAAACVVAIIVFRGIATAPAHRPGPAQIGPVVVAVVSFIAWILAIGMELPGVKDDAQPQIKAIAGAFALLWTWLAPNFVKGD